MSNKKGISKTGRNRSGGGDVDEVEELLFAAEDHLLLNLNLNSHLARSSSPSASASSPPIDDDLVRRFQALKSSKSQPQQKVKTSAAAPKLISDSTVSTKVPLPEAQQKEKTKDEEELEKVLGADLSARFAALKGSSSSSSSKTFTESQVCPVRSNGGDDADDEENEEDEVEKVIQWAIDAARLDPSSPTDDDDDDDDGEENDDDDDEEKDHRRKQQQEKKKKKK